MTRKLVSITLCIAVIAAFALPSTALARGGAGKKPSPKAAAHGKKAGAGAAKFSASKAPKAAKAVKAPKVKAAKSPKLKAAKGREGEEGSGCDGPGRRAEDQASCWARI